MYLFTVSFKGKIIIRHIIINLTLEVSTSIQKPSEEPNNTEKKVISEVGIYGKVTLEDGVEVLCYEIFLRDHVRIDQSKVAIQHYVRKLLTSGQAALINFISPMNKDMWRFTLVAKDSELTKEGITEKVTHPKRYTYLIETGSEKRNKTLAERLESLSLASEQNMDALKDAFSVEKMSKTFFDEYKEHYQNFVQYLTGKRMMRVGSKWQEKVVCDASPFLKSVFNGNEKNTRDFCKKLLGRIIFLYFVQKKRWLGASSTEYEDGSQNFIYELFLETGGDEKFFPLGLTELFFNALNRERSNDDYITPTGRSVKIPYLNGGLFTRDEIDELLHKKGDLMTFPKELFSNPEKSDIPLPKGISVVIEDTPYRGFLDFLNAFNFTVYEDGQDDYTVAVDPEMLGHIFENLLEDNKDKGAFYTPKEIVTYMCQESLIEYLKSSLEIGLSENSLQDLIREKEAGNLNKSELIAINEKLDSVKVCDPAIGSGAFPMGLLQEIFNVREIIAYEAGLEWDAGKVKEDIIQNAIYGVDIEKGAVDIARLRFWLSLVVDKEKPKALPNLDYKIVVGDSLLSKVALNGNAEIIEIDWSINTTKDGIFGQQLAEERLKIIQHINEKQVEFFHPNAQNKEQLKSRIRDLKIDLLIKQLETMVQTMGIENKPIGQGKKASQQMVRYLETEGWKQNIQKLKQLKQQPEKSFDHFDWKLDFPEVLNEVLVGESKGFDIVIGNPPYVQLQKMGKDADDLSSNGYETYTRTGDIYCLFYELGYQLLKPNGILTFITSNKWMRAAYGEALRKYFVSHSNPLILIDFGGYQVFESATVDTNILVGKKSPFDNKVQTCVLKKGVSLSNMSDYFRQQSTVSSNFSTANSWVVLSSIEQRIKEKIEVLGTPLKEWDVQINYGIKTGFNKAFIISSEKRNELIKKCPKADNIIRPILRGRDIHRYKANWQQLYIIGTFPSLHIDIEDYPEVKDHLMSFGHGRLKQSGEKGSRKKTNNKWFETQDSISYWEDFFRPKIVYPEITKFINFYLDNNSNYYVNNKCFILSGNHVEFLTAFLNSSLFKYCFINNFPELLGGTRELRKIFMEKIPILKVNEDQNSLFSIKINELQKLRENGERTISKEKEIDQLIFNLYKLTDKEKQEIGFFEIK